MAEFLDGYTGADIQAICEEATLLTIRDAIEDVNIKKIEISKLNSDLESLRKEYNEARRLKKEAQISTLSSKIDSKEQKLEDLNFEMLKDIKIKKRELDQAIDKILKGADRAKKAHDSISKGVEEMYR